MVLQRLSVFWFSTLLHLTVGTSRISHVAVHTAADNPIALRTINDLQRALKSYILHADTLTVSVRDRDHTLTAIVGRTHSLIPTSLKVKYYLQDGSPTIEYIDRMTLGYSFTGHLKHDPSSSVQFTFSSNEVHGVVKKNMSVLTIVSHTVDDERLVYTVSERHLSAASEPSHCGNSDVPTKSDNAERSRREVRLPAQRNTTTRYIEIYAVASKGLLDRTGSVPATVKRLVEIINYASSLYTQLNIYLALVQVQVWSNGDPFPVDQRPIDDVLHDFNEYRSKNLNPETRNDNSQLFSAHIFADGVIGRASTTICSNTGSEAVIADLDDSDIIAAATTMAHELGHNLGFRHDDEIEGRDCTCPRPDSQDDKCIMVSVSDSEFTLTRVKPGNFTP